MRRSLSVKIFVADKIHTKGIEMLKRAGFKLIECYGLTNDLLIKSIKIESSIEDYFSCLIVRSVRSIRKKDVDVLLKTPVRLICTASSGFDNIDIKYCKSHRIKVLNVPYGNYISAGEHTVALMLNILKSVSIADSDMKKGLFKSLSYKNFDLSGKKVGIIGVGKVGSYVAKICKAFDAEVLGNDIKKSLKYRYKWVKFKKLNDLLRESDIVTIHTPLDETTRNLLNNERLKKLKRGSILINCARGGIVDEKALIRLLKSRKIYYAALDVFVNEPNFKKDFIKLKNVLLTPHLAGKTIESTERISVQLAERIIGNFGKNVRI
jgi:D-3-phosphoglycerate dehydrogenase